MNKFLKITFILFLFLVTSYAFGKGNCPPWDTKCSGIPPGGPEGQGTGRGTPIDDYLPILIISAVAIAGLYSYKERKIIKK